MTMHGPIQRFLLIAFVAVSALLEHSSTSPFASSSQITQAPAAPVPQIRLPLKANSVRFAVIGDSGTGTREQYQVGQQMARYRKQFPFEFVVMLGDNIYGHSKPEDFKRKFEDPYKSLLDADVKFYASLGNHDDPDERFYKPFNMGGKRYYSYKKGNVAFFALDSNYMDPEQLSWLERELSGASSAWKICYFHHPLYSDGEFHGSDLDLRARLEPVLERSAVNLVFAGHEHVYERIAAQHGIHYFVLGNSGELRFHNLRPSSQMMKGFDTDRTFALFEIAGDELYFQIVSRTGDTVDAGMITRQSKQSRTWIRELPELSLWFETAAWCRNPLCRRTRYGNSRTFPCVPAHIEERAS